MAEDRKVILPISAAHAVETTKVFGQRRSNLARTMLRLSRGWEMRSPLQLRQEELQRLFTPVSAVLVPQADVFTLEPNALWSEGRSRVVRIPRSATAVDGFVERLSWSVGLTEMLLSEEQRRSEGGASIASRWAASFQELAQYLPTNPKAKEKLRDFSRFRFITDMQDDAVRAASFCGLAPEEYVAWLSEGSEDALHLAPALGRIREVLHLRLSNPDDKWEANDLNDLMYFASAAGYSDFVVCERKTANRLNQVESRVPRGAKVFRRLEDLMAQIGEGAG